MKSLVLRIAVPSPLRRTFDYLVPAEGGPVLPGARVRVPFGRQSLIGLVIDAAEESSVAHERLRPVSEVLDAEPLLSPALLRLLKWACGYYHHPPGEVYATALPPALRQGQPAQARGMKRYRLTAAGVEQDPAALSRAPRQAALLALLRESAEGFMAEALSQRLENWQDAAKRLRDKGWVEEEEVSGIAGAHESPDAPPELNDAQRQAIAAVGARLGEFSAFLLDGVTGSGKTEVYLGLIETVLAQGRQALVLVPEIGLTPQLLGRFRRRFSQPIAVFHSGLSEGERLANWLAARDGSAPIVIGTRSAVFAPLRSPGLIIIDEEHDASYKQQEGFRYSGRDVAVMRAHLEGIPIVLGSATPALESLHNVQTGRYQALVLPERAGAAIHPTIRLIDVKNQPLDEGLSPTLLKAVGQHLSQGNQVLLFINRRGFSPVLLCHDCGWVSNCQRCDAHLTFHAGQGRLRCHHCGGEQRLPVQCPTCGSPDLLPIGQGTERVEQTLERHFPDHGVVRIDRDSTRRKGAMQAILEEVETGRAQILIGTQMLAKGHHFPGVTLVGILHSDQGLFSADFRAGERMAQLIVQVAGRAGRAERPGEVLVQTHHPEHPLLRNLVERDYAALATELLAERREAELPPFSHIALLRAEATDAAAPIAFLQAAKALAQSQAPGEVSLFGPVPAPMERRAGRYRAQLLIQAPQRAALHQLLGGWAVQLESLREGKRVRWSLDVDPAELF